MKNLKFLILFLMLPFVNFSQDAKLGDWFIAMSNKQINEKWNWHKEIQYRNYNMIGDLEQLLVRTGIGYNLSESNNNLLLGYGFIKSENYISDLDIKEGLNEHRIFQQFTSKHNSGRFNFLHRKRFEQRFIDEDFKMRFRYFVSLNIPLNNQELIDKTAYISVYNELFLNAENNLFDRDRLYGGIGFKYNQSFRFEFGYMNQFLHSQSRDQINIMTFFNF